MFQMLPESSGRLVALRVSGKLTKEDMVSVAPPLEEKIRENGKVDLFCDMTDLHGWSLGGFWAELKFDAKHAKDFRRVAVITGKTSFGSVELSRSKSRTRRLSCLQVDRAAKILGLGRSVAYQLIEIPLIKGNF